jgi:phosphopantothenoylcysteine decarboxylase / phosphopantothenate---cysteine ligase
MGVLMGSLTVRNIGEDVKKRLRLRAAQNGRSMEEEIRLLLASAENAAPAVSERKLPDAVLPSPVLTAGTASRLHRVLLVIGGGIAAYKSLDLIRRLQDRGANVSVIMTKAAQEFVTPLSAGALADGRAFTDLFDPRSEFDVGHIRLARDCDLIVVAPATADLIAKMANGLADDLASAVLLATRAPILIAPAMNPRMWEHPATARNVARLRADGISFIGPNVGAMAESGEAGAGRMAEPLQITEAANALLDAGSEPQPLAGKRVVITSGPTHEPIDPVRYIANRSSGKQGHAIARAAAAAGADVILVSGPVTLADPGGVKTIRVETAREMLAAVEKALPADVAIFAAAVADWRVAEAGSQKLKKDASHSPELTLVENPDILATIARSKKRRPTLVIGFAAETENVIAYAKAKLARKGCDWILANDVSAATGIMGGDSNSVHLVTADRVETWPTQSKDEVARMLIGRVADALKTPE